MDSPESIAAVQVRDPERVVWLSQTTLSVDETMASVAVLRERFPAMADPPSDDICYATSNRQAAVKAIAPQAELVIVVGSANSSNSVRLAEVALDAGARSAHRVDTADELDEGWLHGVATVGLTSGASVPEVLVDQGPGLAGGPRLRRRGGGPHRHRVVDLRPPAGAAPPPRRRPSALTLA